VALRLWTPQGASVGFVKQVAPAIEDLTARAVAVDALTADYPTGAWGEEFMKWRYTQHLQASYADYWLARGDPAKALEYADACIAGAETTGAKRNIGKGRRARSEALLASGRLEEAEEAVEEALQVTRDVGNPAQVWKTLAVAAVIRSARGRAEDAVAGYRAALDTIDEVASKLSDAGMRAAMLESGQVAAIRRGAAGSE
jgi:tetratricopeptide (TPR) repeat protein